MGEPLLAVVICFSRLWMVSLSKRSSSSTREEDSTVGGVDGTGIVVNGNKAWSSNENLDRNSSGESVDQSSLAVVVDVVAV